MPPDPGEPHAPDPRDFEHADAYMAAFSQYLLITHDVDEVRTGMEAVTGIGEVEDFLKEKAGD